jgi:hypothetical protein
MDQDMPARKNRGSKTETLSLRLDPKTKWIMEFVARMNGQTLTAVIERAIQTAYDHEGVGVGREYYWRSFWDPDEGVRTLRLLACEHYPTSDDDDDLRHFTKAHWEFFYNTPAADTPRRHFVEILWPKVEKYRRIWHEQRETDYWAAGKAMAADLSAAQVEVPKWPRPPDYPV